MRRIRYGIDIDTGLAISQIYGEGYAIPVLDFAGMKPENNFKAIYNLEKFDMYPTTYNLRAVWTRKIPVKTKNHHRKFWGMKPLKG